MIWKLVEKFGDSAAAALFWILIIFAIAGALIWMFNRGVDYMLNDPGIKKLKSKKSNEESEE
jgi:hypothetical protein